MPARTFSRCYLPILWLWLASCATDVSGKKIHPELARQKYQEALQLGSQNAKQEMYVRLQEAIGLDPTDPNYPLALGGAYFSDGDLDQAESAFLAALRLGPKYFETHRRLGRLYMQKSDWGKAIFHFRESLKSPAIPAPQEIHNWLAFCHYAQNHYALSEQEWINALNIEDNAMIRLNLAMAYRDQGRFDSALESLQKALALDPNLPQAHHHLALLLLKKSDVENAKKHFRESIRLDPQGELAKSSREYLSLLGGK
jgi:Tfp pilus assembly protein PilF